jgi:hypothetical protein
MLDGIEIHELFTRDEWIPMTAKIERPSEFQILESQSWERLIENGKWRETWCMRRNDKHWERMRPVLQLASLFMRETETGPWYIPFQRSAFVFQYRTHSVINITDLSQGLMHYSLQSA